MSVQDRQPVFPTDATRIHECSEVFQEPDKEEIKKVEVPDSLCTLEF